MSAQVMKYLVMKSPRMDVLADNSALTIPVRNVQLVLLLVHQRIQESAFPTAISIAHQSRTKTAMPVGYGFIQSASASRIHHFVISNTEKEQQAG